MEIARKFLLRKKVENGSRALAVMRTERILLRPWTREDVDPLHALWTAPELRRYLWDIAELATPLRGRSSRIWTR